MSKMLPGLKLEHPWLAEAPSNSLVQVCRNLDRALNDSFRRGKGFPRFKARGKCRESFYVYNQAVCVDTETCRVWLPKTGLVRFRAGRLPEGRILAGNVAWNGKAWELTLQCEVGRDPPIVTRDADTVVGVDLGVH